MNLFYIVFVAFSVSCVVELFYYLFFYLRLSLYKEKEGKGDNIPVSVIICARNESENLLHHLPGICEQMYPTYEVIVVDDCSLDDTQDILRAFTDKYNHLRTIKVQESRHFDGGKKFALTLGIKGAKYENVVLIDADCKPKSDQWLQQMASGFIPNKEIVLGYGGYEKNKGLLNKLIRFDTVAIAAQYFSFALAKTAYMGVGRNLAYKKQLFFEKKGFSSHQKLKSGDDDLFISQASNTKNTAIKIDLKSHTISVAKKTFRAWFLQKQRHLTTSKYYKKHHLFLLSLFTLSRYIFWISAIFLLVINYQLYMVLGLLVFRIVFQYVIFRPIFKKLDEIDLWIWSIFLEIGLLFIYPIIGIRSLMDKQKEWTKNLR